MNGTMAYDLPSRVKWWLWSIFTIFMAVNSAFASMVVMTMVRGGDPSLLPWNVGDTSFGVRLGLLLVGALPGWFAAGLLYRMMVREYVRPVDSSGPAYSVFSYILLVVGTYAFLGAGAVWWVPVAFLVVTVLSTMAIWSLVGWAWMLAGFVVALIGGALPWFLR